MKTPKRWRIPIPEDFDPYESESVSAERHGVCRKTIWKWRRVVAAREKDLPSGPESS